MKTFRFKVIQQQETIGEILMRAREKAHLTRAHAALAIGVQEHYVAALEESRWQDLPGSLYVRRYLEQYAKYLGLPSRALLMQLGTQLAHDHWRSIPQPSRCRRAHFVVWPKRLRAVAVGALLLMLIGYLGMQLVHLTNPPPLTVDYPPDGFITHLESLTVSGRSAPEARLMVNNEPVTVRPDGTFSISLTLSRGVNYIHCAVAWRFGRERIIERRIVRDDASNVIDHPPSTP
ncbi:MAG: helix-turn-helix domain-containing protein [Patescibacteria group bacterium]